MITLDDAKKIISAGEKKASEIGQPMNIAVVDAGGNLIAHVRMDGAWIGSIDISIKKAFTSRAFDISTKDLSGEDVYVFNLKVKCSSGFLILNKYLIPANAIYIRQSICD